MVYGPNGRSRKHAFWKELRDSGGATYVPWVICGGFNAIFLMEDKNTGIPNLDDIHSANLFLHDLGLQEPPAVGRRFTWTNCQTDPIWVKLDHFLVSNEWVAYFSRVI